MKHFFDTQLVLRRFLLVSVPVLCFAGAAQAASVSYYIDQSNVAALPDGNNYLKVTIADGADSAIDFTIEPQAAYLAQTGGVSQIVQFAFSTTFDQCISGANVVGLPGNWMVRGPDCYRRGMDGFGKFDVKVRMDGIHPASTLSFSIIGVSGDTPSDYVEDATSLFPAPEGYGPFAATIQYLLEDPACSNSRNKVWCNSAKGFVGGGSPVPAPATAWLLLSGFAGLVTRARRRMMA